MESTRKFDELYKFVAIAPQEAAWTPDKVFARVETGVAPHLCIAAGCEQAQFVRALLENMPEPFWLLYVLIVPCGEGQPGRYQVSEPLTRGQVSSFLKRFQNFLELDRRHNVWLKSELGPALLVWDRHNLVYAYDLANSSTETLQQLGWVEVDRAAIALPDPHAHNYHAMFDDDARDFLATMDWSWSPLQEQDY
jgi:hypothetical protein